MYNRAELPEEAVNYALSYIKMKPVLSSDERNAFANAFKNLLTIKRNSLRSLVTMEKKEKKLKVDLSN